jgi:hypothetical protein
MVLLLGSHPHRDVGRGLDRVKFSRYTVGEYHGEFKEMAEYLYTPVEIPPAEVEKITGLSTTNQRDWRRRGLISRWPGFVAREIAEIEVMNFLAEYMSQRLGPASEHAQIIAPAILWFALFHDDAWNFKGTPNDERAFRKTIRDAAYPDKFKRLIGATPGNWGIYSVFQNCKWKMVDEQAVRKAVFEGIGTLVLNHHAFGGSLIKKIGRPIVTVQVKDR